MVGSHNSTGVQTTTSKEKPLNKNVVVVKLLLVSSPDPTYDRRSGDIRL